MKVEHRADELELQQIVERVVDSILEAPESEIDAELRAYGEDPAAAAERLRGRIRRTVEWRRSERRVKAYTQTQQALMLHSPDLSLPTPINKRPSSPASNRRGTEGPSPKAGSRRPRLVTLTDRDNPSDD
ncbi:MAG: hypothetical protein AAF657_01645 [Acidobacteriota bacterium]